MTESEREFLGNEWVIGNTYGFDRTPWVAAILSVTRELGRDLEAWERDLFAKGFLQGQKDREEWGEKLIAKVRAELADEIPF